MPQVLLHAGQNQVRYLTSVFIVPFHLYDTLDLQRWGRAGDRRLKEPESMEQTHKLSQNADLVPLLLGEDGHLPVQPSNLQSIYGLHYESSMVEGSWILENETIHCIRAGQPYKG